MRSIFGWDLPPGCRYSDLPGNQPDPPCAICGCDVDSCICPECPKCGTIGDPDCYAQHGLVRTQEQIDSLATHEKAWAADAAAEAAYWASPERKADDEAAERYWAELEAHHAKEKK